MVGIICLIGLLVVIGLADADLLSTLSARGGPSIARNSRPEGLVLAAFGGENEDASGERRVDFPRGERTLRGAGDQTQTC